MGAGTAASLVRTARALYRGPLTATGQALTGGEISPAHAQVLAADTQDLPAHVAAEAEPVLLGAARRLDPPRLRRAIGHLRGVADPDGAGDQAERRYLQRGCGWHRPGRAWSPSAGCWTRRPVRPWWPPWSRCPPGQCHRPPLWWPAPGGCLGRAGRRSLEAGQLPQAGGVRSQLTVTVDLVSRHRTDQHHPGNIPSGEERSAVPAPQGTPTLATRDPTDQQGVATRDPTDQKGLAARLRTAARLLPRPWVVPRPSRWRSAAPAGS